MANNEIVHAGAKAPAVINNNNNLAINNAKNELDIQLIKQINPKLNQPQLDLFIAYCKRLELDPVIKQIYAILRWSSQTRSEEMTIQTSIDGLRLLAARTELYCGQTPEEWCGKDGIWRDSWLGNEPPSGARVGVYTKNSPYPTYGTAFYNEYYGHVATEKLSPMVKKMPAHMLSKCAEAKALRKAFPNYIPHDLYISEEMVMADYESKSHVEIKQAQPEALPEPSIYINMNDAQVINNKLKVNNIATAEFMEYLVAEYSINKLSQVKKGEQYSMILDKINHWNNVKSYEIEDLGVDEWATEENNEQIF